MHSPAVDRAATWTALLAALYLALAPVNGFVVCHEPDGSVSLELATAEQRCAGCDDRPTDRHGARHDPICTDHRRCPCVDVPLTPDGDPARVAPAERHAAPSPCAIAPDPARPFDLRSEFVRSRREGPPPRPPPGMPQLRSIVLVV